MPIRRSLLLYCAVLLACAWPWVRAATHALPSGALLVSPSNARLHAWALAWVARALATDPSQLYQAPISYPAPAQLSGMEHFLSSQIVFAPVYWSTGNALLGANTVALLSYPLGALAMERLLLALGSAAVPAWVGGLIFALGPMRVPGNLQILQYLNLYLPVAGLALMRLRERQTVTAALALVAALAAGALSSYYLAVMLALFCMIWTCAEFFESQCGRSRFIVLAVAAAIISVMPLVAISEPYFAGVHATDRGIDLAAEYVANRDVPGAAAIASAVAAAVGRMPPDATEQSLWPYIMLAFLRVLVVGWFGVLPLMLGVGGLAALRWSTGGARRLAIRGVLLFVIAFPLMFLPLNLAVGRTSGWLATVTAPLRLFRLPYRFAVLAGVGSALLATAGLQACRSWFGEFVGNVAAVAAACAVLTFSGSGLVGQGLDEVRAQTAPIYDLVRDVTNRDAGPLLELPEPPTASGEREAMLAATRHGLPLINGYTGYPAAHRDVLLRTIARLPAHDALADLVDLTHLRWLLLHPTIEWPSGGARAAVIALPDVHIVLERDGWALARVDRTPSHPEWFAAIAAGGVPVMGSGKL